MAPAFMDENVSQPDLELARLMKFKSHKPKAGDAIGPELISFFKQNVEKRQGKFAKIADAWNTLVPSTLLSHCALESFSRGSLAVIVDSSPHLYEMKQLLLAGLERQLLLACKSAGLKKITLKIGRWYEGDGQKLKF
jgi:hypothetical protein